MLRAVVHRGSYRLLTSDQGAGEISAFLERHRIPPRRARLKRAVANLYLWRIPPGEDLAGALAGVPRISWQDLAFVAIALVARRRRAPRPAPPLPANDKWELLDSIRNRSLALVRGDRVLDPSLKGGLCALR